MADVDHPKTHVENDKDAELPRTQPESPKGEGIDPLTESDTLYPAENTKELSEKLDRKQLNAEPDTTETDTLVADQEEVAAKANTPNANLPEEDKTPTSEQVAKEEAKADDTDKSADKPKAPADAKEAQPAKAAESPSDGSGVDASKAASK